MSTKPKYKAVRSKDPYDCSVESARDIICQRCTWTGAQKIARALSAMEDKPKTLKSKRFVFDWSGIPEKYKWAAMDESELWAAYVKKPTLRDGIFESQDNEWTCRFDERPPYPGDWRDSLQKRP